MAPSKPRLLAIGDIHGCFRALSTLVEFVGLTPEDRLVTLGDYVNRGPNTHAVLDWLIHRRQTGVLIPLRGNHEQMMFKARENPAAYRYWLPVGRKRNARFVSPFGG